MHRALCRSGSSIGWVLCLLGFGLSACGDARAKPETTSVDAFVGEHNRCDDVADCTLIPAACDLRCWIAVPADFAIDARRLTSEEGERLPNHQCPVDCPRDPTVGVACVDGACTLCSGPARDAGADCAAR